MAESYKVAAFDGLNKLAFDRPVRDELPDHCVYSEPTAASRRVQQSAIDPQGFNEPF